MKEQFIVSLSKWMEHINRNGEDRQTVDPKIAKQGALYSVVEQLKVFNS